MTVIDSSFSDARLAEVLAEAGSPLSPGGLRALVSGVNAAPPSHDPGGWMALAGVDPVSDAAATLRALKAAMAPAPVAPDAPARLAALRQALRERGLDGFVVPHADEYQNEYLPPCAERLAWLTGFDGSAGQAVVTASRAAIFVDGRYTLQARAQVPDGLYEHRHLTDDPLDRWVADAMAPGNTLGYDPRLHTPGWAERTAAVLKRAGIALTACADNPVDALWTGRPAEPLSPVVLHPERFAGVPATGKLSAVAAHLRLKGAGAAVLTAPESAAWLFNLRGGDVACAPLALARAVVTEDGEATLFVDPRKLTAVVREALERVATLAPPESFEAALTALGRRGTVVTLDPATASVWVADTLRTAGATVSFDGDPCALPRARKNAVELDGARAAHRRDGVAMARFLRWLEGAAPAGTVTERSAAEKLRAIRAEGEHFRGLSFETIAGAGPNGAIVHYHVTPETDRTLEPGTLFLIDSGAQYLDGTTDVTRTVAIGAPTEDMRRRYTLVLKGHIALATARFPAGTTGSQLDSLARAPLWAEGLDYDHGTGHGVGSYLSVHEGPQRISKIPNAIALEPGMILSNEPGFYAAGAYGIRLENLVAVTAAEQDGGERPFLAFETLTLVPFDHTLIDASLLTPAERAWLGAYHRRVASVLMPLLDSETAAWLTARTGAPDA